ncbi:MAG: chorismate synthase, partial [Planctomycetota bacterium]
MAGSTFGHAFRVTTFGESHGAGVGCVIDGCPPGIVIDWEKVQDCLDRRRPGQSKLVTPRNEEDRVECLSGIHSDGRSLGSPIALLVRNKDQRSQSYQDWHHIYRPSHADWSYDAKYGLRAWQGGGRASARETIGRVAAGAIAEQVFQQCFAQAHALAWVEEIHDIDTAAVH